MNAITRLGFTFATIALCSTTVNAAGLFRTYVSGTGSDVNPCTLAAPCRLLPAALAVVSDGGEIWILSSADFNTGQVNITKSVSIVAIPGVVGSVAATGGDIALFINGANIKVGLRNLAIVASGAASHGVLFRQGAELNVQDCEIANLGIGILSYAAGSKVVVKDTVLRDNGVGFYADGSTVAVLDGVQIRGNQSFGAFLAGGAHATVSNSILSNNASGAYVFSGRSPTELVVTRSVVTGNKNGLSVHAFSLQTGSLVSDGNVVTNNDIAFAFPAGGYGVTIYTRQNNTVQYNGTNVSGGVLTPLTAI